MVFCLRMLDLLQKHPDGDLGNRFLSRGHAVEEGEAAVVTPDMVKAYHGDIPRHLHAMHAKVVKAMIGHIIIVGDQRRIVQGKQQGEELSRFFSAGSADHGRMRSCDASSP